MAKEAMQAVSRAEQAALETVQQAKEEADRLRREAAAQGEQLVAAAVKEARKRADVLCGVARADGKKAAGNPAAGKPEGTGTAPRAGRCPPRTGCPGAGTAGAGPAPKEVRAWPLLP